MPARPHADPQARAPSGKLGATRKAPDRPRRPPGQIITALWHAFAERRMPPAALRAAGARIRLVDVSAYLKRTHLICRRVDQPQVRKRFTDAEHQALVRYMDPAFRQQQCLQAALGLARDGRACFASPLGGGTLRVDASIQGPYRLNVLLTEGADEPVVLLQRLTSLDAVLLPRRRLIVLFKHVNELQIAALLQRICDPSHDALAQSADRRERRFCGFLVGNRRPYHFFYNNAPALLTLLESLPAGAQPPLLYEPGCRFVEFATLFDLQCAAPVLDTDELNALQREAPGCTFRLGIELGSTPDPAIRRFDERLLQRVERLAPADFVAHWSARLAGRTVFWLGVTGQKRSWVEQVDGIAALIGALGARYPGAQFVIDGWTASLDPDAEDRREIAADRAVLEAIRQRLADEVALIVAIGLTPAEKLVLARHVTCFVSNHSTGSMLVGRIAQRRGVTHSSTRMDDSMHIHPHTLRVPRHAIRDVDAPHRTASDRVDYHADWRVMLELVVEQTERALRAGALPASDDGPLP